MYRPCKNTNKQNPWHLGMTVVSSVLKWTEKHGWKPENCDMPVLSLAGCYKVIAKMCRCAGTHQDVSQCITRECGRLRWQWSHKLCHCPLLEIIQVLHLLRWFTHTHTQCRTRWETSGSQSGDKVRDKVGNKAADKVPSLKWKTMCGETSWETSGREAGRQSRRHWTTRGKKAGRQSDAQGFKVLAAFDTFLCRIVCHFVFQLVPQLVSQYASSQSVSHLEPSPPFFSSRFACRPMSHWASHLNLGTLEPCLEAMFGPSSGLVETSRLYTLYNNSDNMYRMNQFQAGQSLQSCWRLKNITVNSNINVADWGQGSEIPVALWDLMISNSHKFPQGWEEFNGCLLRTCPKLSNVSSVQLRATLEYPTTVGSSWHPSL